MKWPNWFTKANVSEEKTKTQAAQDVAEKLVLYWLHLDIDSGAVDMRLLKDLIRNAILAEMNKPCMYCERRKYQLHRI